MSEKLSKTFEDLPICLSVEAVAKILNVNKTTVYTLVRRKDFPSIQVSRRRIIIPKDALQEWLCNTAKGGSINV